MPVAPQCVRTQSSHQCLFTLLGSTPIKAVGKMLMKLSPDVIAAGTIKLINASQKIHLQKKTHFKCAFSPSSIQQILCELLKIG